MSGEEIEAMITETILTDRERILLPLLFASPEQTATEEYREAITKLTDDINIDKEHMGFLLMLAILGERTDWKAFPKEAIPRLKGIYRYYLVQNLNGMNWLLGKVRILQAAGIPVMFIKGIAMRCYYAPGIARIMSDYDIAVPRERFREAMSLLRDDDTVDIGQTAWSDTIRGSVNGKPVELDVHQWIFKHEGDTDTGIWDRAIPVKVQDTTVLVPCPADMFIHQLHNQSGNYFIEDHSDNRMKWLFDCRHIQLGDLVQYCDYCLDPEELRERAVSFCATYPSRLMMKLHADCFQDNALSFLAEQIQPATKGYVHWLKYSMEQQDFLKVYNRFHFEHDGPLTLTRCRMSLKKSILDYKLYRSTPLPEAHRKTWISYLLWSRKIDSYAVFKDRYLVRIKNMILRRI